MTPSEERCLSPLSKCYTVSCAQSWSTLYNRWPDDSWSWSCCPSGGKGSALGHLSMRTWQKTFILKPELYVDVKSICEFNCNRIATCFVFLSFLLFLFTAYEAVMTNLILETLLWFTKPVLSKYCQHTIAILYSLCVYGVYTWFSVGFWNETEMIWKWCMKWLDPGQSDLDKNCLKSQWSKLLPIKLLISH